MDELIADLTRRLDELEAENRVLAAEVRALRRSVPGGGSPGDGQARGREVVTRRGLLRHVGTTAAAAAGGLVAGASVFDTRPAAAVTGAMQYGTSNNAGADETELQSSDPTTTLTVYNSAASSNAAIYGSVTNTLNAAAGVAGYSVGVGSGVRGTVNNLTGPGAGILGVTNGTGEAVRGQVFSNICPATGVTAVTAGTGTAIDASCTLGSNTSTAVVVTHAGTGRGVDVTLSNAASPAHGVLVNVAGSGRAVYARSTGSNQAVFARMFGTSNAAWALVENPSNTRAASLATTNGSGPGVEATSAKGVGGRFTGKTAQVRLVASAASSHPTSGVKGDLFVDKSGRLWFCKGGTTWKQLA